MSQALDKRLNIMRPDLADARLRGQVAADNHVAGTPARVAAPVADLHASPRADSGVDTQLLFGDEVEIFERREGWAWVQATADGYCGYASDAALAPRSAEVATHVVTAPRSFIYPAAELRMPTVHALSMGSRVTVEGEAETRGTRYAPLAGGGAIIAAHLAPVEEPAADYVAMAERLIFTPYLWGGTSAFGIDCSGLIQLAMRMTGRMVLRDTDMQAASIGTVLDGGAEAELQRGDLVFWTGHVGIMTDGVTLLHASGHAMMVCREPLADAVSRIERLYGPPTGFRRPAA